MLAAELDWQDLADADGQIPRCRGRAEVHDGQITNLRGYATEPEAHDALHAGSSPDASPDSD